jgi:DNA ligase (NAD+)
MSMRSVWKKLNKNPYNYAKDLSRKDLEKIIKEANVDYYNNESQLTDEIYDIVKNILEYKYPTSELLTEVGAVIIGNKVKLPTYMGSMDKLKPDTSALKRWLAKYSGPYIVSDKLDGISLLIDCNHSPPRAYTRGNGKEGQDVSWIVEYITIGNINTGFVRGELIVSKEQWEDIKFISQNPRNFVSGYISRKKISKRWMKYIDFVAYEYITEPRLPFKEQLELLTKKKYNVVRYSVHDTLTSKTLSDILIANRSSSSYEIDGVIITNNEVHERIPNKNPPYAKAFKMVLDDQRAESTVLDINWKPSMYGLLKPVVRIEKINLGGATIQNISAYNARFIKQHNIGPGAIVEIVRSGDVIPKILKVVKAVKNPMFPDEDYTWTSSKVDIVLTHPEQNDGVKMKIIEHFFATHKVPFFKRGTIIKTINAGFNTIPEILRMTISDFTSVDGISDTSARKYKKAIHSNYSKKDIATIMAGSTHFGSGFAITKTKPIIEAIPDILTTDMSDSEIIESITNLSGFSKKSGTKFMKGLPSFKVFYHSLP